MASARGAAVSKVNEYRILKTLGEGSYGSVFLVERLLRDSKTATKKYAMKKVKLGKLNSQQRDEAVNEVRILASFKHPHIIRYRDSFVDRNDLCVVMDLALGGDLGDCIQHQQQIRKYFKVDVVWRYFLQIADGLNFLHQQNVVHRDLKPQNILVCQDGTLKIGDLGCSKIIKMDFARTQVGTPYYMSPEIYQQKPYNDKSDVWSLGCMLFELLALQPPFKASSLWALARQVTQLQSSKLTFPAVPQFSRLRDLTVVLLTKDPRRRPSMAAVLALPIVCQAATRFAPDLLIGAAAPAHQKTANVLDTIKIRRAGTRMQVDLPKSSYTPLPHQRHHHHATNTQSSRTEPAAQRVVASMGPPPLRADDVKQRPRKKKAGPGQQKPTSHGRKNPKRTNMQTQGTEIPAAAGKPSAPRERRRSRPKNVQHHPNSQHDNRKRQPLKQAQKPKRSKSQRKGVHQEREKRGITKSNTRSSPSNVTEEMATAAPPAGHGHAAVKHKKQQRQHQAHRQHDAGKENGLPQREEGEDEEEHKEEEEEEKKEKEKEKQLDSEREQINLRLRQCVQHHSHYGEERPRRQLQADDGRRHCERPALLSPKTIESKTRRPQATPHASQPISGCANASAARSLTGNGLQTTSTAGEPAECAVPSTVAAPETTNETLCRTVKMQPIAPVDVEAKLARGRAVSHAPPPQDKTQGNNNQDLAKTKMSAARLADVAESKTATAVGRGMEPHRLKEQQLLKRQESKMVTTESKVAHRPTEIKGSTTANSAHVPDNHTSTEPQGQQKQPAEHRTMRKTGVVVLQTNRRVYKIASSKEQQELKTRHSGPIRPPPRPKPSKVVAAATSPTASGSLGSSSVPRPPAEKGSQSSTVVAGALQPRDVNVVTRNNGVDITNRQPRKYGCSSTSTSTEHQSAPQLSQPPASSDTGNPHSPSKVALGKTVIHYRAVAPLVT